MKRSILLAAATLGAIFTIAAQEANKPEGYKFTDTKTVKTVPVTNQYKSGTCWCFSTVSFIEEEILRAGGPEIKLSEMWIVRNIYFEKAVKYVRLHGSLNFAVGGAAHDVTHAIEKYGIVPREVYKGLNYGTEMPEFGEIDEVLKAYVDAVIKNKNGKLTPAWQDGLNAILDAYFGERPETFTYEGKEYTPHTFAESLPVKMSDYIEFSSYTHHPFYSSFIIEVPDNWLWGEVYNVPLNEMMQVIDDAIAEGHPVAWGTDVSEKGFRGAKAIGIIPEEAEKNMVGSDAERWGKLSSAEKEAQIYSLDQPVKEKTITQEMRQTAYDNYETTDDHGMVIVGTAVDQNGSPFYKVQNSWGDRGPYEGFYYFSRPFVEYKTMDIMVNKNVVSKELLKKLGLK
ncbi:aminopeptidase [Alistipes sp. Z76]|nr:aminopeptidase [Alistipes sp. Z76]NCE70471.1 aminopeptidase [Muribaculaceae bacterium M3]